MSLLAGFDLLIELSNKSLQNQIAAQVGSVLVGGGGTAGLPIDLSSDKITPGLGGGLHLIITDILIDLRPANRVDLTLPFVNASSITESASEPTKGKLTVEYQQLAGQIQLTNCQLQKVVVGNSALLQLNLKSATPTFRFADSAANDKFQQAAEVYFAIVFAKLLDGIKGAFTFGSAFTVDATADGVLSPLRLTALESQTLLESTDPNNRAKQALGLFIGLSKAGLPQENLSQHTRTVIQSPNHYALALSPFTYQHFIFAPLAAQLTSNPQIKKVSSSLEEDYIAIVLSGEVSGWWGSASGTVTIRVTLAVEGGQLQADLDVDDVQNLSVHGSAAFYASVGLTSLFIGPGVTATLYALARGGFAIFGPGFVKNQVQALLDGIQTTLNTSLNFSRFGTAAPGLALNNLTTVAVTAEGILVQGENKFKQHVVKPTLRLQTSSETIHVQNLETTTFQVNWPPAELSKTYPLTYQAQTQQVRVKLDATLVALPAQVEWSVQSNGTTVPITTTAGVLSLQPVSTTQAKPFPKGTTSDYQTVTLAYQVLNSMEIAFTNKPEQGNYDFTVLARVVDASKTPVKVPQPVSTYVVMEGSHAELPDSYYSDLAKSQQMVADLLKKVNKPTIHWPILDGGPVQEIGLDRILPQLQDIVNAAHISGALVSRTPFIYSGGRLAPLNWSRLAQTGGVVVTGQRITVRPSGV